ncbi:hypothetical protein UFOVP935_17 [uncultured Caudovirales phage]|uniref:Uncharacterized protein n=1 Tax=uncultured Caudovirales phage TaxID=2100421 RepID=A0A6J5PKK9_9CAUD|nr:hypothetical protein UFOVP935_17 [uncultured Caudovirales phage]
MTVIVSPPVPKTDHRFDDWMYLFWKRALAAIAEGGGLPAGGSLGQHLAKASGADGDVLWEDPPGAPDLTDYAYLPGRSGGQILRGGIADDETLILQGTAGTSTASADAVLINTGIAGADTAIKVRGDGAVAINGDYDSTYGMPTTVTGGTLFQGSDGQIGMLGVTTDTIAGGFFNLGAYVVNIGQVATQTSNIGSGAMLSIFKNQDMNGFDNTTGMLELLDSPIGSGNRTNVSVNISIDSTIRCRLYPRIPDGTVSSAYIFDTSNTITDSNTKLISVNNHGATKFSVDFSGMLFVGNVPAYADDTAAMAGGLVAGNIYRIGNALQVVL